MAWSVKNLLTDMVVTVKTVSDFANRVSWNPPETAWGNGPWAYLEYGPAMIEQGSEEVIEHAVEINCMVPMRGNFDGDTGEYAQAVDLAVRVHRAFYTNVMVNGEAAIGSPGVIAKPDLMQYGEVRCIRCKLTINLTTAEDVGSQVTD